MAHEIGRMFYYGERPWHKLGTALNQPADIEEALREGGLDWEVEQVPITPANEPASSIPHRMAVVRKDRKPGEAGRVIGVLHPGFRPLQNRAGAKLFDALLGRGERVYHTGGYLRHGEVVWLLARIPRDIKVQDGDVVEPYLLFSNSHDGSQAIDIRLTTIRVVCQNTLTLALSGKAQKVFRRGHNDSYAVLKEEAKGFFNFVTQQCDHAQALFERLSREKCDAAQFRLFLLGLMPDPARPVTAQYGSAVHQAYETRLRKLAADRDEIQAVFREGLPSQGISPVGNTWWGAINAVTAWVDHQQTIQGPRYAHMLFGAGDRLKSAAMARGRSMVVQGG